MLRRRKSPAYWTEAQLVSHVRAVYLGGVAFVPEAHGAVDLAAIVFHQDPALLPRKMVRYAEDELGGFVRYCFYGLWWNDYFQTCVNMGDDPSETFRTYSGHATEGEARAEAKRWLRWDGNQPVENVAFDELPGFGQRMVLHVVRRGAGNLGRNGGAR